MRSSSSMSATIAAKKARSELYATCCARPMQSSAMNSWNVRLNTATHSRREKRVGRFGAWPTSAGGVCGFGLAATSLVAVEDRPAADARPLAAAALPAAPGEVTHGRADTTGED